MNKKIKLILILALPILGLVAGYLLMGRDVMITLDGENQEIHTRALTVRGAVRGAGITLSPSDRVEPPAATWLSATTLIEVNRSRPVRIWVEPSEEVVEINSPALTPMEILKAAGFLPSLEDEVRVNGRVVSMQDELSRRDELTLQYIPAVNVTIYQSDGETGIRSAAANLGIALWNEGIRISGGELFAGSLDSPLADGMVVDLGAAHTVEITVDGKVISTITSAETVGDALSAAGVTLQDLDYSKPTDRKPLPGDGKIQVVRVREELLIEQVAIPYEIQRTPDSTLEVNQTEVDQEGKAGLKVSKVRVRYEDGVEVSRASEADVILAEPVTSIVRYGSKITYNTISTEDGVFTYYLAVDVIATSYSPCRSSGEPGVCYPGTALGIPVQKGVAGMKLSWYLIFRGSKVYIPGYGVAVIADNGVNPFHDRFIDLGYSDDDYVMWGAVPVTIYFLEPAPATYTGVLP